MKRFVAKVNENEITTTYYVKAENSKEALKKMYEVYKIRFNSVKEVK